MHEMAIAEGILDIAREHAAREKSGRVTKIGLLIGEMAGVEEDALRFCFSSLVNGTLPKSLVLLELMKMVTHMSITVEP